MNVISGCLIVKDGKVLLVKEGLKDCYGKWNLPAGRVDEFENITTGAIREVYEETGLNVKLLGVLPISERIINDNTFISIRFVAEIIDGDINYDYNEIIDVRWFEISDILKMTKDELRSYELNTQVIKNYCDKKIYPLEVFDDKQYIN